MPRRESRYTIRLPSGAQAGSNSGPGLVVIRSTSVPSAFAVKTSSSLDRTMRPSSDDTSIGSPMTTLTRESIGEGDAVGLADPGRAVSTEGEGSAVHEDTDASRNAASAVPADRRHIDRVKAPPFDPS